MWKNEGLFPLRKTEKTGPVSPLSEETVGSRDKNDTFEEKILDEQSVHEDKADNKEVSLINVNFYGKTRLNAQISNILTDKLTHYFEVSRQLFEPGEKIIVSGEVVVLRLEENWIEDRQNYWSSIKVALRNFVYQDQFRKIQNEDIEVTVKAKGMVEDMLPLTAQALMNKMMDSFFINGEIGNDKYEND